MELIIYDDRIIINDSKIYENTLIITHESISPYICNQQFGSFSNMLKIFLEDNSRIQNLVLNSINSTMFDKLELYSNKLINLTLSYCNISEIDMLLIGPCFTGIKKLTWYMNHFDEGLFEQFIMPYFDYNYNMEYENDDGWYPNCEIYGDGQSLQFKNDSYYFK